MSRRKQNKKNFSTRGILIKFSNSKKNYTKLYPFEIIIIFHQSIVIHTIRSRNERRIVTDFWFVRDGA